MSRLDKFGEIIDEVAGESTAKAPKTWRHRYDTYEDPDKIKGTYTYHNDEYTLRVSYHVEDRFAQLANGIFNTAPTYLNINKVQASLVRKETPDVLESLVTSYSNETYKKDSMVPYIALLEELKQEVIKEKDIEEYQEEINKGVQEIIDKLKQPQKNTGSSADAGKSNPTLEELVNSIGVGTKKPGNISYIGDIHQHSRDPYPPEKTGYVTQSTPEPKKKGLFSGLKNKLKGYLFGTTVALGALGFDSMCEGINPKIEDIEPKYTPEKNKKNILYDVIKERQKAKTEREHKKKEKEEDKIEGEDK